MSAGRQHRTTIENSDIVETEEASLEYVLPFQIFSINPPCKVQKQLVEDPLEKVPIASATILPLFYSVNLRAAQAWTGGFTSPNAHSYAGIWPFGCIYHSRSINSNCSFAKAGSICANATQ